MHKTRLFSAAFRCTLGVAGVALSMLYLPAIMVTPILTGISIVMVVTGTLNVWQVGRASPELKPVAQPMVWLFPLLVLVVFAVAFTVGPGAFGPPIEDLVGLPPA